MRGTVLYGTRDIRFEDSPEPKITKPTDAHYPARSYMRRCPSSAAACSSCGRHSRADSRSSCGRR